ncbi:MAG: hypothetical protein CM15mP115_19340 [Alphaproteobacteria bacterium]|nr:MAG: hypothetical protein CM15mP115_19340 [Alphaproteobacteria bacterium]
MDLFAGCGTLSLPLLAGLSKLTAAESDLAALAAMKARGRWGRARRAARLHRG